MKGKYQHFYNDYYQLRERVNSKVEKLEKEHKQHLTCKNGCDMCCIDYSIFPIEFYAILNELKEEALQLKKRKSDSNQCIFLENHSCKIYQLRPFICRTHGLPLLYTDEEGEWELSACELNFVDFDFSELSIETTFPQDRFNSKLFLLNQKFIADFDETKYDKFDLIPIKDLYSKYQIS